MSESESLSGVEGNLDAVSAPSPEVTRLGLHLLAVRSAVLVGIYLNERFPTEELFMDFLNSDETIEGLEAFAEARDDVLAVAIKQDTVTPESVAEAVTTHHPRALEAIDVLAERIGVTPEDLFSFLLRA